MDRRRFLQAVGGAAGMAALPRCVGQQVGNRPPDILLIVADDLGYADLSVTGRRDYQTPVIDRIAREGAFLTQAYASAPCASEASSETRWWSSPATTAGSGSRTWGRSGKGRRRCGKGESGSRLLRAGPASFPPASHCAQVCDTFDLAATAAALAGVRADPAAPVDGLNLMLALRGGTPQPRDLYWRLTQRRRQKALRSGDWKYLATAEGEFLFDLETDPGEQNDRKAERPEVLTDLRGKYSAWERAMLTPIPHDASGR